MKALVAVLACSLAANGVLAWWLLDERATQARLQDDLDAREQALDVRAADLASRPPAEEPAPALRGTPQDKPPPAPTPSATPRRAPPRPPQPKRLWPSKEATERATRAQTDVLQIQDAARRDSGIRDLLAMIHGDDAATALAALRVLPKLRTVKLDPRTWRPPLLRHLESGDPSLRISAAYALHAVAGEPESDVARYVALARAHPDAALGLAGVAMFASGGKVEGDLADLFVELIQSEDGNRARDAANYLRSRAAPREVHQAVADAWRRHQETGQRVGLWFHILGQMKPLHRPVLEVIFEIVATPEGSKSQDLLLGNVARNTREEDRAFSAERAAVALASATDIHIRRELLRIVGLLGTREQLPALQAFASNELITERERKQAAEVAAKLLKR